nr:MAG TPA: hypothetical protein [Caudoviricetes sp.]
MKRFDIWLLEASLFRSFYLRNRLPTPMRLGLLDLCQSRRL